MAHLDSLRLNIPDVTQSLQLIYLFFCDFTTIIIDFPIILRLNVISRPLTLSENFKHWRVVSFNIGIMKIRTVFADVI